jgi:hypothetical protein
MLLSPCAAIGFRAEDASESRLKAAIVANLTQFVEWPDAVIGSRSTMDVCVGTPDPFGGDLQELVAGESLKGRTLAVRRVENANDVAACQILFLPRRSNGPHPLLRVAANRPILTVGDDPRFLDQGGIIGLRMVDGRVRFDVDDGAARRAGLRISSQLLRLALTVRGSTP